VIVGTIVVAVIGGAATVISALVYRKVGQVHVLVNLSAGYCAGAD
jgi:hypothetical protein